MASLKPTSELSIGMVTSEPVVNSFGQTLLPGGMELTEKHINMLKVWNISAVIIKLDQKDEETEISEDLRTQAKELFLKRLAWEPRNVIEEDIIELGILATAKILMKRGAANAK